MILHIDINSYFATMLQQKYPVLRGKPVGIVKEHGRTCIIAASKEAKKLGVKTGCRTPDAKRLAPDIILQPAEFDFYLDSTKRLKSLFESLSPDVQIYSLDEAFVDITHCQKHLHQDPHKLAQDIQQQIKDGLGEWVTCNIGIAKNRFLAKLASEVSPKGSIVTVTADSMDHFLMTDDFSSVCGIGYRLQKRLHALGITNLYQLHLFDDDFLHQHFGPFWAVQLRKMSLGQEPHFLTLIDKTPHMKSIGRSITGYKLISQESDIKAVLHNLTAEVIHKARRQNLAGRQVYLSLQGQDRYWSQHITVKNHINHTSTMFDLLWNHLYQQWPKDFKIIKFAVRLSLLKPMHQNSLLPNWQKQERLSAAIDTLWQKYGLFSVHSGLLTNRQIIKPEVTGFFGDKNYHLNS